MPHPFADPGAEARKLALSPPPGRLAVPVPLESLLDNARATLWAQAVTQAMLNQSVPAVSQAVRPGDWWLKMTATSANGLVTPHYAVMTPQGKLRGAEDGVPVPVQQWAEGGAPVLDANAGQAAPGIAGMLSGIQADEMAHDPHSLMHRAARIYFRGVTGAPGDGDVSLAQVFVSSLRGTEEQVQTVAKDSDFTVFCVVKLTTGPSGTGGHPQQHIELAWHVVDAHGKEAGVATQLHDVDAHSLDGAWGDVANAAGEEAAGAVHQIVTNYSGRDHKPLPAVAGAAKP